MMRTARNYSQRAFAERLTNKGMRVDASAVSRIEKGTRSVRLVEAMTIAEVLDVPLDFLTSGARTPAQQLKHLRTDVNLRLDVVRDELASAAGSIDDLLNYLADHPELLPEVSGEGEGDDGEDRPAASVEDYVNGICRRILSWGPLENAASVEHQQMIVKILNAASASTVAVISDDD